jgi:putative hydrolase of the HAD superfamily
MVPQIVIFDLDNTLYPRESGLMQEIGRRIQVWLCDYLKLTWEEATVQRRVYLHRYGTTLGGLMAEHDVDVHGYLAFVHDIPVEEYLEPSPVLSTMLDTILLRRAIYTNATSTYGQRVLRALDVADRFEQVIGIEEVGMRNKFQREAYERALALLDARGPECIMVEDSVGNLQPAKELGLTTVWVREDGATARPRVTSGTHIEGATWGEHEEAPEKHVDFVVGNVLEVREVVDRLLCRQA